jgi:hypothetical protein
MKYIDAFPDLKHTSATILNQAIEMKAERMDENAKRRIYRIMTENGWKQLRGRSDRYWVRSKQD